MTTVADGESTALEVVDRPGLLLPRVVLRPLRRGETAPLERVFAGMSARSRWLRYLSGMPALSPAMLAGLADVDQDGHGCWIASAGPDPVAVGRYIRSADDPAVAEMAFEVVDRCQGHGLGRLLVEVLGTAAADAGASRLLWLMDADNLRMRHLAVELGGCFTQEHGVIEGTTGLPQVPELDAVQVVRCARAARRSAVRQRVA